MDNNNSKMENWKKQIIMDPILNCLFDQTLTPEDMFVSKILVLSNQETVNVYSRLAALKHSLSKNLQKQVETKHEHIQESFKKGQEYIEQFDVTSDPKISQYNTFLKNFNSKYQLIQKQLIYWKNITKILHFSKDLEIFRVNTNILKTLMRGYNGQQQTINSIKISKMLKQIINISTNNDFSGIQAYQSQKIFISTTKSIIHDIAKNKLLKIFELTSQQQKHKLATQWIQVFINIGTLKQFVINYFKSLLNQLGQKIKKNMQQVTIQQLNSFSQKQFIPFVISSTKSLILCQQILIKHRKTETMSNVPNLFLKFWQKFVQYFCQTINWVKKHQQVRNPPKKPQQSIIWKYPTIYYHITNLCDLIHQYLLTTTHFNWYPFGKMKQKCVMCMIDISTEYHNQCKNAFKIQENTLLTQQQLDNIINIFSKYLNYAFCDQIRYSVVEYLLLTVAKYEKNYYEISEQIRKQTQHVTPEQMKNTIKQLLLDNKNLKLRLEQINFFTSKN